MGGRNTQLTRIYTVSLCSSSEKKSRRRRRRCVFSVKTAGIGRQTRLDYAHDSLISASLPRTAAVSRARHLCRVCMIPYTCMCVCVLLCDCGYMEVVKRIHIQAHVIAHVFTPNRLGERLRKVCLEGWELAGDFWGVGRYLLAFFLGGIERAFEKIGACEVSRSLLLLEK